jgi:hypothetical protein
MKCSIKCQFWQPVPYSGFSACTNFNLFKLGFIYKELYPIEITREIRQRCIKESWFVLNER